MTTLLLLHGNEQVGPKYQAAMPGAKVLVVSGLGANGYAQLGKQSIKKFFDAELPGWSPPITLAGFSAGGFGVREFLNSADNRAAIATAVFLDSTYGTSDGKCVTAPYDGAIAFAKAGGKLIISYSDAHPAPGICAHAIKILADGKPIVVASGVANHGAQLSEVGPKLVGGDFGPVTVSRATKLGSAWVIVIGAAAITYWMVKS